ncbi:hypothetical protein M758_UG273000 [Ceratodon purpureus]|nr:hypothetical protein M758_UG273000 [Ceratodon purpureus]
MGLLRTSSGWERRVPQAYLTWIQKTLPLILLQNRAQTSSIFLLIQT